MGRTGSRHVSNSAGRGVKVICFTATHVTRQQWNDVSLMNRVSADQTGSWTWEQIDHRPFDQQRHKVQVSVDSHQGLLKDGHKVPCPGPCT